MFLRVSLIAPISLIKRPKYVALYNSVDDGANCNSAVHQRRYLIYHVNVVIVCYKALIISALLRSINIAIIVRVIE